MARSIPKARDGSLHQHIAEGTSLDLIRIGTAARFSWLEQHRSFCFEAGRMTLTARKEQRPGGWYWYAYRRSQGKLHTAYLGKSEELTIERLNTTVESLERAGGALEGGPHQPLQVVGDTALPVQQASLITFPMTHTLAEQFSEPEPAQTHPLPVQLTPLIGCEQEVRMDLLEPTQMTTRCPYKGQASCWSARIGEQVFKNIVWSYRDPLLACIPITGLLSFFNE